MHRPDLQRRCRQPSRERPIVPPARPLAPRFAALLSPLRAALFPAFLAALICAATLPAHADSVPSVAEARVFNDHQLDNLPAVATLRYSYRKTGPGQPPVTDEVVLRARQEATGGRRVQVDYLHGERRLELPEVEHATANPVILYFLENDVRDMHRRLGGKENYFRRRIRLALAETAQVRPIAIQYAGRTIEATQVVVQPYVDDPLQARFKGLARKSYLFTLSDQVPSGVYELRTVVADAAGSATPLEEESLTLQPGTD
jgi:hypothetical protein